MSFRARVELIFEFSSSSRAYLNLSSTRIISTPNHVSVNGELVRPIFLERGILQGGPLSPYLFIIYAEGRSAMLKEAEMG